MLKRTKGGFREMSSTQRRESRSGEVSVFYRFQVIDPRTGEPYVITLSDEGLPVVGESAGSGFDECLEVVWEETDERPRWHEGAAV